MNADTRGCLECKACGWWGLESEARGRVIDGPCPWCDGTLVEIR